MDIGSDERDFFISYRTADEPWAEWIARELKTAGHSVFLQKWDFLPGENWVHKMQQGASSCRRTIAVLTPAYFESNFTRAEWYSAFARDPTGEKRLLIPVRVEPCDVAGLLGQIIYIDLVGLGTDQARRERLLAGIEGTLSKPLPSNLFADRDHRNIRVIAPLPPPSAEDRRNLLILLDRVEQFWIKGVLEQSVQHEALINLGKETKADAVQRPWEHVLEMPDAASKTLPADASITQVFEDVGRLLLILGEPGSGKTMTLLELARDLVDRAWNDPAQPVPLVFHLSSWKEESKTLSVWLTEELRTKYLIPERVGRSWLNDNRLLPLLDGLDEVQPDKRAACMRAINAFLEEHGTQGMAVCSRLQEYTAAPDRLKMRGAICLQPLTLSQVDQYLAHFGSDFGTLRTALRKDQALQDLAQSPLMLGVMTLAYQGAPIEAFAGDADETPEARRGQIFETYIGRMFARKGSAGSFYPQEQTKRWLSWLAQNMQRHGQTIFTIEQMQPTWLGNISKIVIYTLLSRFALLLVLELIFLATGLFMWLLDFSPNDLSFTLPLAHPITLEENRIASYSTEDTWILLCILYSCLLELIRYFLAFHVFERISIIEDKFLSFFLHLIGWTSISTTMRFLFLGGMYPWGGMMYGTAFGIIYCRRNLWHDIRFAERLRWEWTRPLIGTAAVLILFLHAVWVEISILVFAGILLVKLGWDLDQLNISIRLVINDIVFVFIYIFVLITFLWPFLFFFLGMRNVIQNVEKVENYGMRSAIANAILTGFIMFACAIPVVVIWVFYMGSTINILIWLSTTWILNAFFVSFAFGGVDVINHYVLRFIMYRNGYIPWKFSQFLDHCVKLVFLRKVGGGYIFIHRLLLEHFAAMWEKEEKERGGKVVPAGTDSAVMAPT